MSKTKFAFLYKYIFLLAILALLFSVSFSFARYATSASDATGVDIDEFNIDVHLYHESDGTYDELVDTLPEVSTEDLKTYTDTYYLTITNNDRYILYYSFSEKEDNFIFTSVTEYSKYENESSYTKGATSSPNVSTYVGEIEPKGTDGASTVALELDISVNPSVTIFSGLEQELTLNFYLEYQHTEPYTQPESVDLNHLDSEWVELTSSNITNTFDSDHKYYLGEDISLSSSLIVTCETTLCLNGHTLIEANGFSANQLIELGSGANLTVEDCKAESGTGYISSPTSSYGLYLDGSNAQLHLTTAKIYGSKCGVTLSGMTFFYLEEGGSICDCTSSAVYIASGGGTFNMNGGTIDAGSATGVNLVGGTSATAALYLYDGEIKNGEYGVYLGDNTYSAAHIRGGSIMGASSAGVYYSHNTSSTNSLVEVSGSPIIRGDSDAAGIYLATSDSYINLGVLEEGADIGVSVASGPTDASSLQITSAESSSYYYETASQYIRSDSTSYKVAINHTGGYLELIGSSYVNISVALANTAASIYSQTIYFCEYDEYNPGTPTTMSTTTASSFKSAHNDSKISYFYEYGPYKASDFEYMVGTASSASNLAQYGFAFDDNAFILYSDEDDSYWGDEYDRDDNNFRFYAYQYHNGDGYAFDSCWGLNCSGRTDVADLVVVLELDLSSSISRSSINNIVTSAYFYVDGVYQAFQFNS